MSPNGWFSQPVFIPGGDPEAMNEPSLAYPGQLGIRFSYINPPRQAPTEGSGAVGQGSTDGEQGHPKTFKLVQTDSSMATAPYDSAVAWFANQANNLVTTDLTKLGRGRVAGIFKNAVTPGNFCCIQVKGKGAVKIIDTPTAAPDATGKLVIPSSTTGKADCLAAGSAATYPIIGRTVGAVAGGSSTCIVDIDVPEVL